MIELKAGQIVLDENGNEVEIEKGDYLEEKAEIEKVNSNPTIKNIATAIKSENGNVKRKLYNDDGGFYKIKSMKIMKEPKVKGSLLSNYTISQETSIVGSLLDSYGNVIADFDVIYTLTVIQNKKSETFSNFIIEGEAVDLERGSKIRLDYSKRFYY